MRCELSKSLCAGVMPGRWKGQKMRQKTRSGHDIPLIFVGGYNFQQNRDFLR